MAGKKLQGQVAIVTGASRGIGAAAAGRLADAGAMVVLAARGADEVEEVAAGIRKNKGLAIAVPADITDPEAVEEIVESAIDQFNRVDILVNNAGVVWPIEEIAEVDAEEWTYNIFTNLIAPFYLVRTVLPLFLDQHYGRILNIGSANRVQALPGLSAFAAAKAGLDAFTRVLAAEVAGRGVAVNMLDPGLVDTTMQEDLRSVDTTGTRMDLGAFHAAWADRRLVTPASVADLVYWLVGPWGRNLNGGFYSAEDATWAAQVARDLA
jgi:3-oxoacyl-[acyl-carrier protein] reductase